MDTTDTPVEHHNDKNTVPKLWRTPHFAVLTDVQETKKSSSPVDFASLGPS